MNGYKTGGDWTDVTSIGRNEVVFEGRHKEYGAFYIRKRYPGSLLFSQMLAISFIAVCAFIPYIMRNKTPRIITDENNFIVKPYVTPVVPTVIPKTTIPPKATPPKSNPSKQDPPVITKTVDSVQKPKKEDQPIVINPQPNPNPGGGVPNPNPNPNPGGPAAGPGITMPRPDSIFKIVGEMPKFKDGNLETYINSKINYPTEESELGVEGIVYASFVIEKDGSIGNVKLLRGVSNGPNINKEALRVLAGMPKWSPGKQAGHPVRVEFTIPIHFKLH